MVINITLRLIETLRNSVMESFGIRNGIGREIEQLRADSQTRVVGRAVVDGETDLVPDGAELDHAAFFCEVVHIAHGENRLASQRLEVFIDAALFRVADKQNM